MRCSNRLKQEKELMKESTHYLQNRVHMLEDHNRKLLEFGQDCAKRLSKLEAKAGWEPPEKDFATVLDACASALEPAEETAISSTDGHAVVGDDDALDEQASPTQPTRAPDGSAASDADFSAAADQSDIASLNHSTGVKYIYQVSLLSICCLLLIRTLVFTVLVTCVPRPCRHRCTKLGFEIYTLMLIESSARCAAGTLTLAHLNSVKVGRRTRRTVSAQARRLQTKS